MRRGDRSHRPRPTDLSKVTGKLRQWGAPGATRVRTRGQAREGGWSQSETVSAVTPCPSERIKGPPGKGEGWSLEAASKTVAWRREATSEQTQMQAPTGTDLGSWGPGVTCSPGHLSPPAHCPSLASQLNIPGLLWLCPFLSLRINRDEPQQAPTYMTKGSFSQPVDLECFPSHYHILGSQPLSELRIINCTP